MDLIDGILIVCAILGVVLIIISIIMAFTENADTGIAGATGATASGASISSNIAKGVSSVVAAGTPNPYPNSLSLVSAAGTRGDGKSIVPKDLGYAEAGNFKRGYYNLDGTGGNNYCRYVGVPPKTFLACTKDDNELFYSTADMDQGYANTRGIFKLPLSRELAFCRGVGMDSDPVMACIPIKNDAFDKDNQLYLMGKVGRASAYF